SAPTFEGTGLAEPLAAGFLRHRLSRRVQLTAPTSFADRQTVRPGSQWSATPGLTTAFTVGIGSNRPYSAAGAVFERGPLAIRASYTSQAPGFHRLPVLSLVRTEVDRENLWLTYNVGRVVQVGMSRQHFAQDA